MQRLEKINYKERIKLSYDPDDVNIRLQHFRVFELVSMIEHEAILKDSFNLFDEKKSLKKPWKHKQGDLFEAKQEGKDYIELLGDDGMQRNLDLWNRSQQSQFIESLMIKLPVPLFYFDGSRKPWAIIDGLQRLYTIMTFIKCEFKLSGLEYLGKECDAKTFEEIPGYLQSRILDAEVIAYVINPGTPPDVKYNIFKRINTGGLKLTGQEIRNAFFRGKPAEFTKELANKDIFRQATNGKLTSRRMIDREFANRFIAFQVFDYKDYNGKMDVFLSEAMMDLFYRSDVELIQIKHLFEISLQRSYDLFEEHAFYRPKTYDEWGKLPNKALFDTLSWNLSQLSETRFSNIFNRKKEFKKRYTDFMNSQQMFKAIDNTTSSKTSVINRFSMLNDFLNDFI